MHLIVSGVVSDIVPSKKGEQSHCDVLGPGDLIGLEILKNSRDALSTSLCRAITGVELLFVERSQLESALDDNPALQRSVLGYTIGRYLLVRGDLRSEEAAEARLSRLLLRLGESCGRPTDDGGIILPSEITLRTLGELLGMSSRMLRQARQTIQSLRTDASGIDFRLDEVRRTIDGQFA
jgi:CRP-like cAMP-binding protein